MNKPCRQVGISTVSQKLILVAAGAMLLCTACARTGKKPPETRLEPSRISVQVNSGGPIVLTTSAAEFHILPTGYLQALLLKGASNLPSTSRARTVLPRATI